jgi:hypothetical protein
MKAPTLLLMLAVLLLAGCTKTVTQRVEIPYEVTVPVYFKVAAPAELLRRYIPTEYPVFISPSSKDAVIGMSTLDWERLQVILRTLESRDEAWRSWAQQPAEAKP